MCGGLILTVARSPKAVLRYHLGRLVGYCSLGALAGFLGKGVFRSSAYGIVPWLSTGIIASAFIFLGVQLLRGRPLHLFRMPQKAWQKLAGYGPTATGLFSAFLPCGWLHAFILGALGTQDPGLGALYLFFFWLGTLPALSLAPLAAKKILQPLAQRVPRLSAVLLICVGLMSLMIKVISRPVGQSSEATCHPSSLHTTD